MKNWCGKCKQLPTAAYFLINIFQVSKVSEICIMTVIQDATIQLQALLKIK